MQCGGTGPPAYPEDRVRIGQGLGKPPITGYYRFSASDTARVWLDLASVWFIRFISYIAYSSDACSRRPLLGGLALLLRRACCLDSLTLLGGPYTCGKSHYSRARMGWCFDVVQFLFAFRDLDVHMHIITVFPVIPSQLQQR